MEDIFHSEAMCNFIVEMVDFAMKRPTIGDIVFSFRVRFARKWCDKYSDVPSTATMLKHKKVKKCVEDIVGSSDWNVVRERPVKQEDYDFIHNLINAMAFAATGYIE